MSKSTRAATLKIFVALLLLGGAIALNRQEFAKVLRRSPDPWSLLGGFALYWMGTFLGFTRWYVLARMLDLPIKYREALKLGFIAHFFNILIPGAVGGEVIRAGYACREVERKDRAIASVVLQVVFNILGLFSLAAIVGIAGWKRLGNVEHRLVGFVVGGLFVCSIGLTLWLFPSRKTRGLLLKGERLNDSIATSNLARKRWIWLAVALGMATLSHTANVFAFERVAHAFYKDVPTLADHFLFVPLILFSTAFPLPMGALGVSEAISGRLLRIAGFQGGAVVMMGYRLLQYGAACMSGTVYIANREQARDAIAAGRGLMSKRKPIKPPAETVR